VGLKLGAVLLALAGGILPAQDIPRPNRAVGFQILPEPLPDGTAALALEVSSQFLRPDFERSGDGRTFARLDGEEWQLVGDLPWRLGPGILNLRARVNRRSGGIFDQAIQTWHRLLSIAEGGRGQAPKHRLEYALVRDGVTVARLDHPATQLMDLDLAYVVPWGTAQMGGRMGLGVQLPNGKREDFSGSGGTDWTLGGAAWKAWGRFRIHAQAERLFIGLPADSPYRQVVDRRQLSRAWVGCGWRGEGPGFFSGLGLDVTVGYQGSPYSLGVVRIDRAGWQQHWTFSHARFPNWSFSFSEEAGTYMAPDITGALIYRFR
jgi:hypothetical protein